MPPPLSPDLHILYLNNTSSLNQFQPLFTKDINDKPLSKPVRLMFKFRINSTGVLTLALFRGANKFDKFENDYTLWNVGERIVTDTLSGHDVFFGDQKLNKKIIGTPKWNDLKKIPLNNPAFIVLTPSLIPYMTNYYTVQYDIGTTNDPDDINQKDRLVSDLTISPLGIQPKPCPPYNR